MGCLGCEHEKLSHDYELDSVTTKATEFAKEHKKDVVIYWEGNECKFVTTEYAISANIPMLKVIRFAD